MNCLLIKDNELIWVGQPTAALYILNYLDALDLEETVSNSFNGKQR